MDLSKYKDRRVHFSDIRDERVNSSCIQYQGLDDIKEEICISTLLLHRLIQNSTYREYAVLIP